MKTKIIRIWAAALLLISLLCLHAVPANAATLGEINSLAEGVIAYRQNACGAADVNELINVKLAADAGKGEPEWYVISISQFYGSLDTSGYASALESAAASSGGRATDSQRIALALSAVGRGENTVSSAVNSCADKLGIMSRIYGLILMDSRAYPDGAFTRDGIINDILSMRLADGGWALYGAVSDIDVTAMTIQALSPYYKWDDVRAAVDGALSMLSSRQQSGGDFSSFGTRNLESTAQVIRALCDLGIDPESDPRFIKNGHTLIDGMLIYRLQNGGFSHTEGTAVNDKASQQALSAFVSIKRLREGRTSLYRFTSSKVERVRAATPPTSSATSSAASPSSSSKAAGGTVSSQTATVSNTSSKASTTVSAPTESGSEDVGKTTDATEEKTDGEKTETAAVSYKLIAFIVLVALTGAAVGLLALKKKLNKKNILLTAAVFIAAALAVFFINIQTVDEYYGSPVDDVVSGPYVVFEIRCDNVVGVLSDEHIPSDGCILTEGKYALKEGDTAFDILLRATSSNRIQMEYEGSQTFNTVYIKGINYLYERDAGELSGWIYRVNGEIPGVGCSEYVLSDGDRLDFVYTLDLGKDVTE